MATTLLLEQLVTLVPRSWCPTSCSHIPRPFSALALQVTNAGEKLILQNDATGLTLTLWILQRTLIASTSWYLYTFPSCWWVAGLSQSTHMYTTSHTLSMTVELGNGSRCEEESIHNFHCQG